MQSYKKILIILILISSRIECEYWFAGVGKETAVILAPAAVDVAKGAGVEAAQALAPAIADAAKSLGSDAAIALATGNVDVAKILAPAIVDASKGIGSDAAIAVANSNLAIAKEVMPYVGPVMVATTVFVGVGVAAYSVTQLQPIAKDTYYFIYPTEEQKASEAKSGEVVEYIAARVKLRKCFMGSKPTDERNSFGRPIACEEIARIFVACGGKKEVIEMTADFVEYWV